VIRFTVAWLRDAVDELTAIWLVDDDRRAVTDAAGVIDRELALDAMAKGTPLSEGLRVLESGPLRVIFSVDEADRVVVVARLRLLKPRGPKT
jgi:hypothetical protein